MSEHGKQCRTYYRDQLTGEGPKLVWDCRCPLGMSGQPARTELDDLRAQVATLRAALQYAEWSDRNSHCFDCERFIEDGHAPDCSLQVLSSTEAAALAHEARIWNRAIDAALKVGIAALCSEGAKCDDAMCPGRLFADVIRALRREEKK